MNEHVHAAIREQPLDIAAAHAFVDAPGHGAVTSFAGIVRDHHEGATVRGIDYDVHVPLAEQVFMAMAEEARGHWPGLEVFIEHYRGWLDVGGVSVLIAVSSPHRAEAFDGCRYLIEELKKRAPVWKRECYPDGAGQWLPGHSLVDSEEDSPDDRAS